MRENGWESKEPARFALRHLPLQLPSEVRGELEDVIAESDEPISRSQMLATMSVMLEGQSLLTLESAWWLAMGDHGSDFPLLGSRDRIEQALLGAWRFDRRWAVHIALELLLEREWGGEAAPVRIALNDARIEQSWGQMALAVREWVRSECSDAYSHVLCHEEPWTQDPMTRLVQMVTFKTNYGEEVFANALRCFPLDEFYVPSMEFQGAVGRSCTALGSSKILLLSTGLERRYSAEEQLAWG